MKQMVKLSLFIVRNQTFSSSASVGLADSWTGAGNFLSLIHVTTTPTVSSSGDKYY
ncbi:MAG: hypothetical protein IPJ86_03215 [Bacteroidetes bacterium]|nr:hypothetical protein [Bacteroidota bacterium]